MKIRQAVNLVVALFIAFSVSSVHADTLQYPLVSTADAGTTMNDERASKARKLAELVIITDHKKGIIDYDANHSFGDSYQGAQAVLLIDDKRYTVFVVNNKNKASSDVIGFWMRPQGSHREKDLVIFSDRGLDGHCESGSMRGKKGLIIFDSEEEKGLEHEKEFEKIYDNAVATLLNFYQSK